jgi:hypothetical protein
MGSVDGNVAIFRREFQCCVQKYRMNFKTHGTRPLIRFGIEVNVFSTIRADILETFRLVRSIATAPPIDCPNAIWCHNGIQFQHMKINGGRNLPQVLLTRSGLRECSPTLLAHLVEDLVMQKLGIIIRG